MASPLTPPLPIMALKEVDSRFRGNDASVRFSCGDQADLVWLAYARGR
jgi:hypothetical protein